MEFATASAVEIVYKLLPGFLAASIIYSLTPHRKETPFERTVQALIFTMVVQVLVAGVEAVAIVLGRWGTLGIWSKTSSLAVSLLVAIVLGLAIARVLNTDALHRFLRRRGDWTRRTSYPSEWYSAFHRHRENWVVLHLADRRRLFGWPEEWPDHPQEGHFVLPQAAWLLEDGSQQDLPTVEAILVPANDVRIVEMVGVSKENDHGRQGSTASPARRETASTAASTALASRVVSE